MLSVKEQAPSQEIIFFDTENSESLFVFGGELNMTIIHIVLTKEGFLFRRIRKASIKKIKKDFKDMSAHPAKHDFSGLHKLCTFLF